MRTIPGKQRTLLLQAARKVMKHAHAPYSHFRVGAALITAEGEVFARGGLVVIAFSDKGPEGPSLEDDYFAAAATRSMMCEVTSTNPS